MPKLSRAAAIAPIIGVAMTASTLAGAAVYTVAQSGCADGGQYVRHGQQVELVHGCLDRGDLPAGVHRAPRDGDAPHGQAVRRR